MSPKSRRGFVALDVLWIILLLCLAIFLSVRGIELVDRRDKADRLKRELALIDEAVERVAVEESLEPGDTVPFEQYSRFFEERVSKRVRLDGKDPFGGRYGEQVVGEGAIPDPATIARMGKLWK